MPSIRMPEFGRYPQGFEDHGAIRRYLKGLRWDPPTAKASIPYLDINRWDSECMVRLLVVSGSPTPCQKEDQKAVEDPLRSGGHPNSLSPKDSSTSVRMMSRVGQALLDFPQDLLAFVKVVKLQNPSGLVWPNDRLWTTCGMPCLGETTNFYRCKT